MAEIPATAFLIIGAVVAIISLFVKSIFFFVYVGAGFMLYGGGKILYARLKNKDAPKKAQHHAPHQSRQRLCPYCNRQVRPHDNFCANCGALLKHQGRHEHFNQGRYNQHNQGYDNQVRRVP